MSEGMKKYEDTQVFNLFPYGFVNNNQTILGYLLHKWIPLKATFERILCSDSASLSSNEPMSSEQLRIERGGAILCCFLGVGYPQN